ncbi:MAG: hypothetical protein EPN97_13660 [Alphaproteobacteria bacterium]|nr:MAG: hypothetical protein EPN97_13660 [Alphaproteobacteria bacterium]
MDLFKWVGRKKREEEWMRQLRREPSFARELPEDNDRWYVTQEFVNDEDKNLRCYMAVFQPDPKVEKWRIYHIDYDLTKDESQVRADWSEETADPMEVVKTLRGYERKMRNSPAYIAHPSEKPTYRPLANKYGIHFDDDGNIFRVKTEAPLVKGVFMNRETLEQIFHKEAVKNIPLDNWDGIYKGVVDKTSPEWTVTEQLFGAMPSGDATLYVPAAVQYASSRWEAPSAEKPVIADPPRQLPSAEAKPNPPAAAESTAQVTPPAAPDQPVAEKPAAEVPAAPQPEPPVTVNGKTWVELAQGKAFAGYTSMQKLDFMRPVTVADVAADPAYAEYASRMWLLMERLNKLPEVLGSPTSTRYEKESALAVIARYPSIREFEGGKQALAQHLCDATILVGMLRAGNALYKEQFGPGKKFNPEALQLISELGNVCKKFAEERLHIDAAEAAKVADVIAKGADPFGPALPLRKIFEQYVPPAYDPPPPVSTAPKAAKPVKKKPAQHRNSGFWD